MVDVLGEFRRTFFQIHKCYCLNQIAGCRKITGSYPNINEPKDQRDVTNHRSIACTGYGNV